MDKTRILPGDLLVTKGALKLNSSLPEVGLKDIASNGSWLEQKQIQAALEARKHLIEVERIEKSGVLSHAEWREELMLAEVTQKVGGYWQYLGHNVGKRLFLNPEEALFLMEINCLLLKYNEVKVSLQQAYALMLRSKITLMQYKVYASLSRLGYRVFRHRVQSVPKEYAKNIEKSDYSKNVNNMFETYNEVPGIGTTKTYEHETDQQCENNDKTDPESSSLETPTAQSEQKSAESNNEEYTSVTEDIEPKKEETKMNKLKHSKYIQYKIDKLKNRKHKLKDLNVLSESFGNIPEFTNNPIVTVTAPDQRYLPGKVHLKNNMYYLNVEKIQTKSAVSEEIPSTSRSSSGSRNPAYHNVNHVRHVPPNSYRSNNWTEYFNFRFSSQHNPFRQFNFWRPQTTSLNYFQFNMTFQRPFLYPQYGPRIILNPFLQPLPPHISGSLSSNSNNDAQRKKRTRDVLKQEHYNSIQRLASFVKNSILTFSLSDNNVAKLNNLIQSYNTRYKTRLRLSGDFNIIADENIIDTIEVDDDDEHIAKKSRKNENMDAFECNLDKLKQLAYKLKSLEIKNEATSRHRRILSQLLKKFNNSYNVDYYVNDNFDIINRNDLTILTSSDSDEVAEAKIAPRKKLKNPFSILKQMSEKHVEENCASTSTTKESPFKYNDVTVKTFKKDWLPDKSDFGRAEVVPRDFASEVIDTRREEFLFDFLKIQPDKFKNWLDIKISFLQCLQETCELFHYETKKITEIGSLVKPDEFNDTALVLRKLSIFESSKATNEDTNLEVDFDVYNRDVQNFKKSNRPVPHFRVICLRESSSMPSGTDVAILHSKYKDNVTIMFAIVGIGSVSYLQVNPISLPVYTSSNINTV